jgi:3-hydroxyisobutyrate dehydrogenase-like beta-hydroxyacid dehydrogenase
MSKKRIGFVGLGRMGTEMARHLQDAGFSLTVYNRTAEKTRPFAERGARVAGSPRDAAEGADVVFTMVANDEVLEAVTLGSDGVLAGARRGALLIDSSTVSVATSARVAEAAKAAGLDFLRAPVSGNPSVAAAGHLGVVVSGPKARYEESLELLRTFGQHVFWLGEGEQARLMKLALNLMIAISAAMMAEALVLGEKGGLDWGTMFQVMANSALGSPFVKYKGPPLSNRDYRATFTTEMMRKDLDLALEEAHRLGVPMPVTALTNQLLQAAIGSGYGGIDFAALILMLEAQSGLPALKHEPE